MAKINVSLMARVIFHYVQFARELLRRRLRKGRGSRRRRRVELVDRGNKKEKSTIEVEN